jgi:hypothetical protein
MSRLTHEQIRRARKVFCYAHCPTVSCGCAHCIAGHALQAYERTLYMVENLEDGSIALDFGTALWLPKLQLLVSI